MCVCNARRVLLQGLSDDEVAKERRTRECFIDFLLGVLELDPKARRGYREGRGGGPGGGPKARRAYREGRGAGCVVAAGARGIGKWGGGGGLGDVGCEGHRHGPRRFGQGDGRRQLGAAGRGGLRTAERRGA